MLPGCSRGWVVLCHCSLLRAGSPGAEAFAVLDLSVLLSCSSHVPEAVRQELSRRAVGEGSFTEDHAVPVKVLPHSTCKCSHMHRTRRFPVAETVRPRPLGCRALSRHELRPPCPTAASLALQTPTCPANPPLPCPAVRLDTARKLLASVHVPEWQPQPVQPAQPQSYSSAGAGSSAGLSAGAGGAVMMRLGTAGSAGSAVLNSSGISEAEGDGSLLRESLTTSCDRCGFVLTPL